MNKGGRGNNGSKERFREELPERESEFSISGQAIIALMKYHSRN